MRGWMRQGLAAVGLLLVTAGASRADQYMTAMAMVRYDVDSATETFCRVVGTGGTFGAGISGAGMVKTSGSSATVTSNTASSSALAPVVAGDIIVVRPATPSTAEPFGAGYAAVVTAVASADSITVNPAVDWSAGYQYSYFHTVCGTTIDDGWIDVSNSTRIMMTISYSQGDLDALKWRFWCKTGHVGADPVVVYPSEGDGCGNAGTQSSGFCEFATPSSTAVFTWEEFGAWSSCRIGVAYKSTDTAETTTNLERVTGSISVTKGGN